ncbi:hypothetical protein G6F68_007373 [Rhizopus microsporus]|nr:hypothetical protein G6F67_007732 [Rhizopus microsporus]KAG1260539.1 hypothetical protein G6F68_007373 [Rhizopus microsporus]
MNITAFNAIYGHYITGPAAKSWSLFSDITFNTVHSFINRSSSLTVEDVQRLSMAFKFPVSPFLKRTKFTVPNEYRKRAGDLLESLFSDEEQQRIGWDWRKERDTDTEITGEWLQRVGNPLDPCKESVVLYLHGGAYYLCNYEMYRPFLTKLIKYSNCRTCSINYRLAPQNPFPAALEDALATYLYLIQPPEGEGLLPTDPKKIVISGDSAGGGLTMALLIAIRDAGLPLPAGAMPMCPWVDLTHSLPSILLNMMTDFLPAVGFKHAPSPALDYAQLPQRQQDTKVLEEASKKAKEAKKKHKLTIPEDEDDASQHRESIGPFGIPIPHTDDANGMYRVQFYAPNEALKLPMVSPVFDRRRLRGLPPLLVQCGKSERLRDESIYLALQGTGTFPDKDDKQYGKPTKITLEIFVDQPHVFQVMFMWTKPTKRAVRNLAAFLAEVTGSPANVRKDGEYLSDQLLSVKEVSPRGEAVDAKTRLLEEVNEDTWNKWNARLARPSIKERIDEVRAYYHQLIDQKQ